MGVLAHRNLGAPVPFTSCHFASNDPRPRPRLPDFLHMAAEVRPRGMTAPGAGATRVRNSSAMSIMRTHCTSAWVLIQSMKRSYEQREVRPAGISSWL